MVLVIYSPTSTKTCLNAALNMKPVHRIEPLAEAARRHGYLDDVRKPPFKDTGASATSMSHSLTGNCRSGNRIQERKSGPVFGKPSGLK
jgi:hypothetical protein